MKKAVVSWLLLFVMIALSAPAVTRLSKMPRAEDAYIFLRYARNLRDTGRVAYNPGGEVVEGATNLPFLAMTAAAMGPSSDHDDRAVVWVGVGLLLIAYAVAAFTVVNWTNSSCALSVAIGLAGSSAPILAGFGFDAPLCLLASVLMATLVSRRLSDDVLKPFESVALGLAAAFLGMTRIDCLGLALLAMAVVTILSGKRSELRNAWGVFLIVTIVWQAWRFAYFGYPFPNAFYVKTAGTWVFPQTWANSCFVFLARNPLSLAATLFTGVAVYKKDWRLAGTGLIGFLGLFIWLFVNGEQNIMLRYQLPLLPWFLVFVARNPVFASKYSPALAALAIAGAFFGKTLLPKKVNVPLVEFNYRFGLALGALKQNLSGARIAVTEAGVVPYFSGLKTLDCHGLNDVRIAHSGFNGARLDEFQPDLMLIHNDPVSPLKNWPQMVGTMQTWARNHGMIVQHRERTSDHSAMEVWFKDDGSPMVAQLKLAVKAADKAVP